MARDRGCGGEIAGTLAALVKSNECNLTIFAGLDCFGALAMTVAIEYCRG